MPTRIIENDRLIDGAKLDNISVTKPVDLDTILVDAPVDGKTYARKNAAWSPISSTGGVQSVTGGMVDNTDPNNPVILSDSTKADKTNLNKLNFDTTPVPGTTVEGDIFYNETDKTLNIVSDGMTLQVGQETVIRARNITGSAILNNQVVYIAGADSNRPTIVKAQASSLATSDVLGVLTQDIANGTEGFVTVLGIVRDVNTSAFSAGDSVYLSPTTAGTYTNVKPTSPNYIRVIGKILTSNATTGSLFVNTTVARGMDAEQIFEDQKEPMGIPDSQRYNVNIGYNLATREVTISGTFFYYHKGIKYIKTAVSEVVTHSDTIGTKFVYYVGSTLTVSDTVWDIREVTTVTAIPYNNSVATIFWNGPDAIPMEERHGITMDAATHKKFHDAVGCTAVGSGFSLNGTYSVATGTGGLVANSFGVDSGVISDEDLETTIPALTDTAGVGNIYPVFYKTGASGEWRWYFTNLPYLFTATNITYNQNNGGTWQQTQVTANNAHMNMYVVTIPALNDAYKFAFVQSQFAYTAGGGGAAATNLASALSESILQLDLSGFPFEEAVPVQKVVFRRNASYDDNGNCRIEATQKIIGTRLSVVNSSTSPSIHNNLSGRSDTDTHPASSITNTPSGNIAATTVQEAIDELDTEKVPTSRTLTINGTTYDLSADRSWTVINNITGDFTTTATAAGSTTLTVGSTKQQFFTGSLSQNVVLPVTSTLTLGHTFFVKNLSTNSISVNSSGGNTVATVNPGRQVEVRCILTSGTTAASWDVFRPGNIYLGSTVTATGGQTVVTTPTYILNSGNLLVKVNGLVQEPGFEYTETSTTSITFASGLVAGDRVSFIIN